MASPSEINHWQGIRSPTSWYNVIGNINQGNYTDTYLVAKSYHEPDNESLSNGSGQLYTLKIINSELGTDTDNNILEMFLQERDFLSTSNHPSILSVEDIGTWEKNPFYVYDYCSDRLDYIINDDIECLQKVSYAIQLISGLIELEKSNVIHRDIKPANILISGHNSVLADFGLMTYYENYISLSSNDKAFTRHYPAPEFADKYNNEINKLTTKANVFQLGLVLTELFTGSNPSEGTAMNEEMTYEGTNKIGEIDCGDEYQEDIRVELEKMIEHDPEIRPKASDIIDNWWLTLRKITDREDVTDYLWS